MHSASHFAVIFNGILECLVIEEPLPWMHSLHLDEFHDYLGITHACEYQGSSPQPILATQSQALHVELRTPNDT